MKEYIVTVWNNGFKKKWHIEKIQAENFNDAVDLAYKKFGKLVNTVNRPIEYN